MTHRTVQLEQLRSLRAREVDRCARAAAEAADLAERQNEILRRAEVTHHRAHKRLAGAIEQRAARPADGLARQFVDDCVAAVTDARHLRLDARTALAEAVDRLTTLRKAWLRAQARHAALLDLVQKLHSAHRRRKERRMDDAITTQARGVAWA